MPTLDHCINGIFEPGNIGSSSGTPPTRILGGSPSPIITSSNTDTVAEYVTLSHSLTANKTVTWSIVGGADQAQFAISGSILTWVGDGTQSFTAPLDADTDNVYVITVSAAVGSSSTTQTISVTVTDNPSADGTPIGLLLVLTQVATGGGSVPSAPTISNIRAASSQNSVFNVSSGGSTSSNNLSIFGSSGDVGATVNVSLDGSLQGTATTDGSGNWTYALGVIADGPHAATATITTGGGTSSASSSYAFTIKAGLTSLPVSVGQNVTTGKHFSFDSTDFEAESTTQAHNPNPNCCIVVDTHTLSFTLLPTDVWEADPTNRTEIESQTRFIDGQTMNATYEFKLPASNPLNDSFGSAGFTTIGDVHDSGAGSVPYNQFLGSWASSAHAESFAITIKSSGTQTSAYEGSVNLTRDVWHTVDLIIKCVASGSGGIAQTWLDGTQVLNFSGNISGVSPYFWKFGLYRGDTLDQTQVALYRNFQMRIT